MNQIVLLKQLVSELRNDGRVREAEQLEKFIQELELEENSKREFVNNNVTTDIKDKIKKLLAEINTSTSHKLLVSINQSNGTESISEMVSKFRANKDTSENGPKNGP